MDGLEDPSRRVSQARLAAWAADESESKSREKWNMERPDMGEPPLFWIRSRYITCSGSMCDTSAVAMWDW